MDFELPAEDDPRRAEIRAWLAGHPEPTARQLADAGYVAPHWPPPWGLAADVELQLIIDEELARAGVEVPQSPIGLGWAGPTILHGGTAEQQRRWLPGILSGEAQWSQLFSEPDAGSDLASLRTRAERDGDVYVIDGQKIWSTWADTADFGILLARTDPGVPKHRGISYFVIDMTSPGIEVRPIVEMTGQNHFNEVFLTGVRVPIANRIGEEGDGWRLAKVTLANERVSLTEGGVLWGMGPTTSAVLDEIAKRGGLTSPVLRQRAVELWSEAKILELLGYRVMTAMLRGDDPTPIASLKKIIADAHGQRAMNLVKDHQGAAGMLGAQGPHAEVDDPWNWGFLFSRALTIGGGTAEILRNIVAEQLLGLPREVRGS